MSNNNIFEIEQWYVVPPTGALEVGKQYIVTMTNDVVWCKAVISCTSRDDEQDLNGFNIDAILEGSPGFVDAWDEGFVDSDGSVGG